MQSVKLPSLLDIEQCATRIRPYVYRTPTVTYPRVIDGLENTEIFVKLELLQITGSFKPRGAINNILNAQDVSRGITAFSAGNHAIAAAYAARTQGVPATVVMPKNANPFRVQRCKDEGATIEFGDDIAALLNIVAELQEREGMTLIHPFEGEHTACGTATVGFELAADAKDLDAVVVPIGGGGLIAGVAAAFKQLQPQCRVYGVEPSGAAGMTMSLAQGAPVTSVTVDTIADSLGAPMHTPYAFSVVRQCVDEVLQVADNDMLEAMRLLFADMKLAVEPACAAALAALMVHKHKFQNKRIGIVACGSNIDIQGYQRLIS